MTRRQHEVEALRKASVLILASSVNDFSHLPTEDDKHGALTEYIKIGERIRIKAIKLGGEYNRFTGLGHKHKVKSNEKRASKRSS